MVSAAKSGRAYISQMLSGLIAVRCFLPNFVAAFLVAVAGVPEERVDHAELICRYATECRFTVNRVVRQLEVVLGPDTGALV